MLVEDAGIKGIKGVPCTVINNTWVIQGAQIADVFFAVRISTSPSYSDG
jgi:predicted DsbA family dithiol-disulfide isomerase